MLSNEICLSDMVSFGYSPHKLVDVLQLPVDFVEFCYGGVLDLTISNNKEEWVVHLHIDSRAWCLQPCLIAVFVFLIVFSLANQLQTLSCHWGFIHWYLIVDMPKWGLYCSNLGALIPKHTLLEKVSGLITKRSLHVKILRQMAFLYLLYHTLVVGLLKNHQTFQT